MVEEGQLRNEGRTGETGDCAVGSLGLKIDHYV